MSAHSRKEPLLAAGPACSVWRVVRGVLFVLQELHALWSVNLRLVTLSILMNAYANANTQLLPGALHYTLPETSLDACTCRPIGSVSGPPNSDLCILPMTPAGVRCSVDLQSPFLQTVDVSLASGGLGCTCWGARIPQLPSAYAFSPVGLVGYAFAIVALVMECLRIVGSHAPMFSRELGDDVRAAMQMGSPFLLVLGLVRPDQTILHFKEVALHHRGVAAAQDGLPICTKLILLLLLEAPQAVAALEAAMLNSSSLHVALTVLSLSWVALTFIRMWCGLAMDGCKEACSDRPASAATAELQQLHRLCLSFKRHRSAFLLSFSSDSVFLALDRMLLHARSSLPPLHSHATQVQHQQHVSSNWIRSDPHRCTI